MMKSSNRAKASNDKESMMTNATVPLIQNSDQYSIREGKNERRVMNFRKKTEIPKPKPKKIQKRIPEEKKSIFQIICPCCFPTSSTKERHNHSSTINLSDPNDYFKAMEQMEGTPAWQKNLIENLVDLSKENESNWIEEVLQYLTSKTGPKQIERMKHKRKEVVLRKGSIKDDIEIDKMLFAYPNSSKKMISSKDISITMKNRRTLLNIQNSRLGLSRQHSQMHNSQIPKSYAKQHRKSFLRLDTLFSSESKKLTFLSNMKNSERKNTKNSAKTGSLFDTALIRINSSMNELNKDAMSIDAMRKYPQPSLNRMNSAAVMQQKESIFNVATIYQQSFRKPSFSNLGSVWRRSGGNTTSGKSNHLNSYTASKSLEKRSREHKKYSLNRSGNLDEIKESVDETMNTLDNKQVYQVFHRESLDNMDQDEEVASTKSVNREEDGLVNQEISEVFSRFGRHLKTPGSYFYILIRKFLQNNAEEYWKIHESKIKDATVELIDSVKIFSSLISTSAFNLFLMSNVLKNSEDIIPEELFLTQIVSIVISKNLIKKPRSNRPNTSLGEIISMAFLLIHKEAKLNYLNGIKIIKKQKIDLVPILLKLTEKSLFKARELIQNPDKKKPEFLMQIFFIDEKIEVTNQSNRTSDRSSGKNRNSRKFKPYKKCHDSLLKMKDARSPYKKIYYLIKCIDFITQEIDDFYSENNIDAAFAVTAEELFPIIIDLLINLDKKVSRTLTVDLLFCSLFLTESMQMGEVGFAVNTFMAAHEFIVGHALLEN